MAPGTRDVARRELLRRQLAEPDFPLVAPNLQVDVDDVVVRDGDAAQPVGDPERAHLIRGRVVPDDPGTVVPLLDPVRPAGELQPSSVHAPGR